VQLGYILPSLLLSHHFSPTPARSAIDYRHALSLANMPTKVLKPTTARKKAAVTTTAVRTTFVEAVEAADAALETEQDDEGQVGGHLHPWEVCYDGMLGAAHQEQGKCGDRALG
jgi:hypothetical protein